MEGKIREVMSEVSFVQSVIQKARRQRKNMLVRSITVKPWLTLQHTWSVESYLTLNSPSLLNKKGCSRIFLGVVGTARSGKRTRKKYKLQILLNHPHGMKSRIQDCLRFTYTQGGDLLFPLFRAPLSTMHLTSGAGLKQRKRQQRGNI